MALLVGIDVQGQKSIVAFRRDGEYLRPAFVVVCAAQVLEHTHRIRHDSSEQVVAAIDAPRCYRTARSYTAL